jgi:SNF family Na+-dependent transporter
MFLTRFFLWQYFYQMLYAMIPCLVLAWWFGRNTKQSAALARNQRRTMGAARAAEG